jgi:aryl-alcohol dehydrogenase-like predicted oxidoreductase
MKKEHNIINRRNFLKTIGAAGAGSVFGSIYCIGDKNKPNTADASGKVKKPKVPQVPKRKLGKTGVEVSSLSLGTNTIAGNQLILKKALQLGVSYWDTANNYAGGNSERGIGKFLSKNPDARSKLFIVTKASDARSVAHVEMRLQTSLRRMNTKYIDLYYGVHELYHPAQLTDELRRWAERAKKRNLIRFFGFSTHSNMAKCLAAAAKLDWIDVIMTSYNFRLLQDAKMQDAIEACHKAGIGIIAMKTQGHGQRTGWRRRSATTRKDRKLLKHFLQRGLTEGQAKVKAVLEDKRFSSACVGMQNVRLLTSNVVASLEETKMTQADMEVFAEYARETCSGYCAGCAYICDSALPQAPYVSDIMRYLMYYNSYGEQDRARELFAQIPDNVRNRLHRMNYSLAEACCPQHLPIGELVAEAVSKLT